MYFVDNMFGISEAVIGVLTIIYGFIKLAMIYVSIAMTREYQDIASEIPIMGSFVVKDPTLAGKMVEYGLFVFAVFSILRGLVKVNAIKNHDVITSEHIMNILYGVVGTLLIIFYSLVVYTDINIDKDPANNEKYESVNLVHGITFVAMIPLFFIYNDILNNLKSLSKVLTITNAMLLVWLLVSLAVVVYLTFKHNAKRKEIIGIGDAITLAMIPASSF